MRMLENEGLAFENLIDIFDGGPTMTARTDQVASIANARHGAVTGIADGGEDALIATGRLADFRCCFGTVGAGSTIDAGSAALLGVGGGEGRGSGAWGKGGSWRVGLGGRASLKKK